MTKNDWRSAGISKRKTILLAAVEVASFALFSVSVNILVGLRSGIADPSLRSNVDFLLVLYAFHAICFVAFAFAVSSIFTGLLGKVATAERRGVAEAAKAFRRELDREVRQAERTEEAFSLFILAIDRLDEIERRGGSAEKARILADAEKALVPVMRRSDLFFRLDDDRFAFILPFTDGERAVTAAGKPLRAIASIAPARPGEGPVPEGGGGLSASVGIAAWSAGSDPESLLAEARQALAAAAARGNSVIYTKLPEELLDVEE